jgi:hypothetical protein
MDYNSPDTDLLELLKIYPNIQAEAKSPKKETKTPEVNLDDDGTELNNFTIKMYISSIAEEQEVIKELRLIVSSAPDPDLANSLASLEKSLGDKMKMLAELSMHKGRIISQEKLKANDNAIKKEIALLKIAPPKLDMGNHNTINIVATREEILKMALEQSEKKAIGRIVEDEPSTPLITTDEADVTPDSVG